MKKTTEEEWLRLFRGVIIDGIIHKLKHGETLTKEQQHRVDMFPNYDWSQYAKDKEQSMPEDEGLLLSFLKEFNCDKCRYYGRGYGRSMCFYNGLDKGMCLWPNCFFPHVCKNFELLKEGEELGEVYERLKQGWAKFMKG